MRAEATTERVLRLLGLLQRRASWTARELAEELGVTDRCVRRDAARLRSLGYPVHATPGVGGGYRLGSGTRLPPLLLDPEEATATALSLRLAAGGTVEGVAEAALGVLTKLDEVMAPALRVQVRALHDATATVASADGGVDPELLVTIARACRDAVRVRFAYTGREARTGERTVEPVRMVTTGRRWYLMAYDVDRDDWRTFRLDRMADVVRTTWQFRPRAHPDPVGFVQDSVTAGPYRHVCRVRLQASAQDVRALVPPQVGRVDDDTDGWCVLVAGADDLDWLALHVARLGLPAEVLEPDALREACARLGERLTAMGGGAQASSTTASP